MKHLAVLDLGTNTFHLLIVRLEESAAPVELAKDSVAVKLGEGGITNNIITDAAFERGIAALKRFKKMMESWPVDEVRAAGTAALRAAANGQNFIDRALLETGISISIIDGDAEAELIYKGVRQAAKLSEDPALITDIGGGSVEFIICNKDRIHWKRSYPIGAARLMALFHRTDPISEDDISAIKIFLDNELGALKQACSEWKPVLLIGSAGAFDTFAELEVLSYHLDPELLKATEFDLDLARFRTITDHLLKTTHQQRKDMPGLAEIRVDMIIVSSILTRYLIDNLHLTRMKQSAYALKEGLIFS